MSLYLLSKDPKLRLSINRQLKKPCIVCTTVTHLGQIAQTMQLDRHPVLLIDEECSKRGILYLLPAIMQLKIPGKKILLSSTFHVEYSNGYSFDGTFGILLRCSTIEQLISCVVEAAGIPAIYEHLTPFQRDRILHRWNTHRLSSILIGQSRNIQTIRKIIKTVGKRFSCVHIEGETGTGKEVVANLLREESENPDPFIVVNCSTIPNTLADTHLFGNEKGAYTDAKESTPGYIGKAHGGILFLDELEDMSPSVQGKLLRLLETNKYHKVGGNTVMHSQFRLISASNVPLASLRKEGVLRDDLFYRLERLVIKITPLRERTEDIPLLVDHFLKQLKEERRPDELTMKRIMEYSWPGNARELFHELERLSVFASEETQELSFKEILTESVLKKSLKVC